MADSTPFLVSLPQIFGEDLLSEGIRGKLKDLIRLMLDTELDEALAARRYARTDGRAGYRNGAKERTLHTSFGSVDLEVPRGRVLRATGGSQEFQSQILPRYERRTRSLDATLVSLYLSGTNQRRVRKALAPLLGDAPLDKNVVSRLVERLREHLVAWKSRSLKGQTYVYLYLDATNLKVRIFKKVKKVPVLVVLGVRQDGQKEVLAMEPLVKESELAWKEVLEGLVARGLSRPALAIVDGHAGLRNALETTWPRVPVQRCVVHKLRNLEAYGSKEIYAEVKNDYHEIVEADSLELARAAYAGFVRKWKDRVPKVVTSVEEAGEELLTFYSFPREQWKCLRTTNPIERLNLEFKRRVKTQCSLPSEDSAVLLLFGLVLSGQIRFRKINGWEKIVEVVQSKTSDVEKFAS